MELLDENDAVYVVRHRTTEENLLRLERGVRKLGFLGRGRRIVLGLLLLSVLCTAASFFFDGAIAGTLLAVGPAAFVAFALCLYSLIKSWQEAKREIHLQYESGRSGGDQEWEYRFYGTCYEALGKNETSRVLYGHLGRLLELSGMYVLVEKGNVVRYFDKADVTRGDADELASFLEKKSHIGMEWVKVRG